MTLAVVNEEESTLAKCCDAFINVLAGNENGVASTKVFSNSIMAFTLLSVALGEACGTLAKDQRETLIGHLKDVPKLEKNFLQREVESVIGAQNKKLRLGSCKLWDISCQNVLAANFIVLGRGFNFPIALEGAVKCKEV